MLGLFTVAPLPVTSRSYRVLANQTNTPKGESTATAPTTRLGSGPDFKHRGQLTSGLQAVTGTAGVTTTGRTNMYNHPYLLQGYSAERQSLAQSAARQAKLVSATHMYVPGGAQLSFWRPRFRLFGRPHRARVIAG